jgi:hypothetical protein
MLKSYASEIICAEHCALISQEFRSGSFNSQILKRGMCTRFFSVLVTLGSTRDHLVSQLLTVKLVATMASCSGRKSLGRTPDALPFMDRRGPITMARSRGALHVRPHVQAGRAIGLHCGRMRCGRMRCDHAHRAQSSPRSRRVSAASHRGPADRRHRKSDSACADARTLQASGHVNARAPEQSTSLPGGAIPVRPHRCPYR